MIRPPFEEAYPSPKPARRGRLAKKEIELAVKKEKRSGSVLMRREKEKGVGDVVQDVVQDIAKRGVGRRRVVPNVGDEVPGVEKGKRRVVDKTKPVTWWKGGKRVAGPVSKKRLANVENIGR